MTRDELIEELKRATVGNRELDCWIELVIGNARGVALREYVHGPKSSDVQNAWQCHSRHIGGGWYQPSHWTTSRDAMLPGTEKLFWRISGNDKLGWYAEAHEHGYVLTVGNAMTEPLARRIAEIKALVGK